MICLSRTSTFWPLLSESQKVTSSKGRISWLSWTRHRLRLQSQLLRPQPFSTFTIKKTILHLIPRKAAVAQPWTNPTASLDSLHTRDLSIQAWVSILSRSRGRHCPLKMGPSSIEAFPKSACPSRNRYLLTKIKLMLYYFTAIKIMDKSRMRMTSHPIISWHRIQSLSIN